MKTHCLECGFALIGRADKKFCNDQCRTNYHNRLNNADTDYIKPINRILKKNRSVLKNILNGSNIKEVSMDTLLFQGFDFKYYTHKKNPKPDQYWKCVYEFRYLRSSGKQLIISRDCSDQA